MRFLCRISNLVREVKRKGIDLVAWDVVQKVDKTRGGVDCIILHLCL
jgi:hypothetical protein